MNCMIIDDENHCIKTLSNLLDTYFPGVNILAACNDSLKAHDLIQENKPDFVFLDIEMPFLNGFDLLSKFEHLYFDVIFTTAYDSYAIKAIKYSALDYLLKPVDKEELAAAIEKIRSKQSSISKIQLQMATAVHGRQLPDIIALPTGKGLTFISVNDIIYCAADVSCTRMYLVDNSEILLSKPLGDVSELLSEYGFFRIHHSSLINLKKVKRYKRGEGGEVIMIDGKRLLVARARKTEFLTEIGRRSAPSSW